MSPASSAMLTFNVDEKRRPARNKPTFTGDNFVQTSNSETQATTEWTPDDQKNICTNVQPVIEGSKCGTNGQWKPTLLTLILTLLTSNIDVDNVFKHG